MSTFDDIVELIHATEDKKLLENLLHGLTTEKEQAEIAQRLDIVKALLNGTPQQQIAKDLGVGVATVTRGSHALTKGHFQVLKSGKE